MESNDSISGLTGTATTQIQYGTIKCPDLGSAIGNGQGWQTAPHYWLQLENAVWKHQLKEFFEVYY